MYAGGLSYFSGGIFVSGFHVGACPEAVATAARNARKSSCSSRLAVLATGELRKRVPIWLGHVVTRYAGIRFGVTFESARFTTCNPFSPRPPCLDHSIAQSLGARSATAEAPVWDEAVVKESTSVSP